jgi:hypothetical protein
MDLGRIDIWSWSFGRDEQEVGEVAAELKELGCGALWFPNHPQIFKLAAQIPGVARRLVAATGIAGIWTHSPEDVTRPPTSSPGPPRALPPGPGGEPRPRGRPRPTRPLLASAWLGCGSTWTAWTGSQSRCPERSGLQRPPREGGE